MIQRKFAETGLAQFFVLASVLVLTVVKSTERPTQNVPQIAAPRLNIYTIPKLYAYFPISPDENMPI